jgi:membrane-bound lytic murein transglycosylase A
VLWHAGLLLATLLAASPWPAEAARRASAPPAPPPLTFRDLPGWDDDSHAEALRPLVRSCRVIASWPDNRPMGPRAGTAGQWEAPCEAARQLLAELDAEQAASAARIASLPAEERWAARMEAEQRRHARARRFFEIRFRPLLVGSNTLTGYFEPEFEGSIGEDERFPVPLYGPPEEDALRRESRAAIYAGALEGKGLEIAWIGDPIDAFFLAIQGSGRIRLWDGRLVRVGYAGQNGQPFIPIGRRLIEAGEIASAGLNMQSIRDWMDRAGPLPARELREQNPSYVYFRIVEGLRPEDGPIGAMGIPLTPMRSLAVDRAHVPLGAPVWLASPREDVSQRLYVAQDVGGAIRGAGRADVFTGWGEAAARRAGDLRDPGRMWMLVPTAVAEPPKPAARAVAQRRGAGPAIALAPAPRLALASATVPALRGAPAAAARPTALAEQRRPAVQRAMATLPVRPAIRSDGPRREAARPAVTRPPARPLSPPVRAQAPQRLAMAR